MSQVGIFDDEDDDNDGGNVAAVLMKAGILSMLEGVLKRRQRLGKKAAALLKTQVGRLVNMILHPNVQLRDREAIHYVDSCRCFKFACKAFSIFYPSRIN